MAFRLFVDSSNGVTVEPEFNMSDGGQKTESRHRMRDGSEFVYKWGEYDIKKITVKYVNSEFKSKVNSWWSGNDDLLWMEEGTTGVTSVHIINKKKPIDKFQKPYNDQFTGKIELGTY